jgi:hypothetical protein
MGDPRKTDEWQTNVARVLAASDLCHLCGHHGAKTGDHIITVADWPPGLPGVNGIHNIAPAHGARGPHPANRCPECHRLCNQVRGTRALAAQRRSRDW